VAVNTRWREERGAGARLGLCRAGVGAAEGPPTLGAGPPVPPPQLRASGSPVQAGRYADRNTPRRGELNFCFKRCVAKRSFGDNAFQEERRSVEYENAELDVHLVWFAVYQWL